MKTRTREEDKRGSKADVIHSNPLISFQTFLDIFQRLRDYRNNCINHASYFELIFLSPIIKKSCMFYQIIFEMIVVILVSQ